MPTGDRTRDAFVQCPQGIELEMLSYLKSNEESGMEPLEG